MMAAARSFELIFLIVFIVKRATLPIRIKWSTGSHRKAAGGRFIRIC